MSKPQVRWLVFSVILGVLVAPSWLVAAPPSAQWAWCAKEGPGVSSLASVAVASDGSVYAVGTINGAPTPFDLGGGVTVKGACADRPNAILVRFGPDGTVLWARSPVEAAVQSAFSSICIDSSGNIYAAGSIGEGRVDFGNGVTATGTGDLDENAVLLKFDSSGTAQWARSAAASTGKSGFNDVAVDSLGNVYVVGDIRKGVFEFGEGVSATGGPSSDCSTVLLRYDPFGKVQWARSVATGAGDRWRIRFISAAVDASGSVYVAGYCGRESFDLGNGVKANGRGVWNALLARYDPTGAAQWATVVDGGAFGSSWYSSVTIDPSGSIVAAGICQLKMAYGFGGGIVARGVHPSRNALLVKYDGRGAALWARAMGESDSATGGLSSWGFASLATDAVGALYLLAGIHSTSTVGLGNGVKAKGVFYGTNGEDGTTALVVKCDDLGAPQWAETVLAASTRTEFTDLALDARGGIYAVGWIGNSAVTFAPGVIADPKASAYSNAVLVKYEER